MMNDENDIVIQQPSEEGDNTPTKATQSVVDSEPILEEPAVVNETPVTTLSSPPLPTPTPVGQRRGCVLLFLGAILGAILGTVLTLSILLGLNGSLTFTSTDAQLRRAINDTRIEQEDMTNELATRSAQIEYMATQMGGVVQEQGMVNETMGTVEAGMDNVFVAVTAVSTQVSTINERIETTENQLESAAAVAAEFDAFLNGLKALLIGSGEGTATPAATEETTTGTPHTGTATPEQTTTSDATAKATRTPRPTSTPLPLPTSTNEP
jgi:hypothetical protein